MDTDSHRPVATPCAIVAAANSAVEDRVETGAATPEKLPEHLRVDA